jgi:hypothetical protein
MAILRFWWLGLGLLLLVGCGDGDDDDQTPPEPPGGVTVGSLVAGTGGYVDGVFVWTDYAYDDRGANADAADGGDRTQSAFAGGDAAYPASLAVNNAADLIQLQIFLDDSRRLSVRAVLETLVDPAAPVLAVAFDTDADAATGAATLPGDGWQTDAPLGVDVLLEVAAPGARLWEYREGTWSIGEAFDSVVDPEENILAASVPADLLAARGRWRVVAALGVAGDAGSWLDGAADIFDLAFVANEPFVRWQNNLQADILAGALDARLAVAEIDFAMLASGATTLVDDLAPGFHTLLYRSKLRLAEGIAFDENGSPSFLGPYQPYLAYVPEDSANAGALSVFLHGSDQNHLGAVFQQPGDFYIGTGRALSEDPHLIETLGFAGDGFDFPPHMLQVYPLARGARLGYRGIAHQDVLDVLADTMRRFAVDPDRVILLGASMGGIGTYRIASLQPDKWSVALPLIGFQTAELLPLTANLLNLPVRQINGAADPLIPLAPAEASAQRLDELGYDYRYWLLTERGHEAGGFAYDCVFARSVDFVRQRRPARVIFVVDPSLDAVDAASGLELRFDSAYWVSQIRARDVGQLARVEAVSRALPLFDEEIVRIDRLIDNTDTGADLCGPNPDVRSGDEWRERAVEVRLGDEAPSRNEVVLELRNVARLNVDLAGAGLGSNGEGAARTPIDGMVRVATDGPTELTLGGLRRGQKVESSLEVVRVDDTGSATIAVAAGESLLALTR